MIWGITLELQDYPLMYRESSSCAASNQKKHFQLFRVRIALLLAYAVLGAVSWTHIPSLDVLPQDLRALPFLVIAVSLAIGLVFTVVLETKKYDRLWFSSRAIAEAIKKETWLFMMKAKPYDQSVSNTDAKKAFLAFLKQVLKAHASTCSMLTTHAEEGSQITQRMKEIRRGSVAERLEFYEKNRIHDQQTWYEKKAKWNMSQESHWNILMWLLQALAVSFAIVNIVFTDSPINLIGVATTAGTAVLSWINARNYQELSQSYGLIAQELSISGDQAKDVSTEEGLAELVSDVEAAISQEHAMWKATRSLPKA